jgi:hypothetical protein
MEGVFGIGSGAAGIISLELEITQGLLKYYAAWKDQDKDINGMYNSLSNLSELLTRLHCKIQPPAKLDMV